MSVVGSDPYSATTVGLTFWENFFLRPESLADKTAGKIALKVLSGIANFVTFGRLHSHLHKKVSAEMTLRGSLTICKSVIVKYKNQLVPSRQSVPAPIVCPIPGYPCTTFPFYPVDGPFEKRMKAAVDEFGDLARQAEDYPSKDPLLNRGQSGYATQRFETILRSEDPMQALIEKLTKDERYKVLGKNWFVEQAYLLIEKYNLRDKRSA